MLSLILADGALYADLEEPDMIKPPVVYVAGMLRQTGTYITSRRLGLDARPDGPARRSTRRT